MCRALRKLLLSLLAETPNVRYTDSLEALNGSSILRVHLLSRFVNMLFDTVGGYLHFMWIIYDIYLLGLVILLSSRGVYSMKIT